MLGATVWPLIMLAGMRGGPHLKPAIVVAALVMLPIIVLLHELGHVLTARLLRLEVPLITIGRGPVLWTGQLIGPFYFGFDGVRSWHS